MIKDKNFDSFIFTHIPKCGGTSLRKVINESAISAGIPLDQIYIPGCNGLPNDKNLNQLDETELKQLGKKQIKVLACHCKFNAHKQYGLRMENPFYFTVLREPVERFISHYNFFYYKLGYNKLKGKSLNQLSKKNLQFIIDKLSNIEMSFLTDIKHVKIVGLENILKVAIYNIQYEYNYVGLLDSIGNLHSKINEKLPDWFKLVKTEVPKLNTNKTNEYEVNESIIDLIKDMNQYDCEIFKFTQSKFSK